MTIILDPASKTKTARRTDPVEREVEAERQPLLPPVYSPATDQQRSLPSPVVSKQDTNRKRTYGKWIALGLVVIGLGLLALFRSLHGGSLSSGDDWMTPPSSDGKPTTRSPLPLPARHTHERSPSWPRQPLYSRTINIDLDLDKWHPDFFFHATGVDAVGQIQMIAQNDTTDDWKLADGVARVSINVIYANEERLKERVRIWKVADDDKTGVNICTPTTPVYNRGPSDYISFEVVVHLPARLASGSLVLGAFDGQATGMKLKVGHLGDHARFDSFKWRSRNSNIDLETMNAHTIDLATTNGHILLLPSLQHAFGLNATVVRLGTTNGNVDLVDGDVRVASSVHIETTNGHVSSRDKGPSGGDETFIVSDGSIDIKTTNNEIRGSFSASSISAVTNNGEIAGTFSSFLQLLNLRTSNAPIRATITPHPFSRSHPEINRPIPVHLRTTSGLLAATFPTAAFVDAELETTNERLVVNAPNFFGEFEFRTSAYQAVVVTGDGVRVDGAGKGWIKGEARGKETEPGGKITGKTSNGGVRVEF